MSIPFEIPIVNQDVVNGVSYTGSTLTLTRAEGSDLTTNIPIPRTNTFSAKQYDEDNRDYDVTNGNAPDDDPNDKGGLIDTYLTCVLSTGGGTYSGIALDFSVVGEWGDEEENKGVAIARAKHIGGSYVFDKILRAPANGDSARFISPFTISFHDNTSTTLECCNGKYIDTDITADTLYSYTVLLVNSRTATSTANFKLNRVVSSGSTVTTERGVSSITAQVFV